MCRTNLTSHLVEINYEWDDTDTQDSGGQDVWPRGVIFLEGHDWFNSVKCHQMS